MTRYPQHDIIRKLFRQGQPLVYAKSDIIMGNDASPNGVYYIDTGYVKAYSISNAGDKNVHLIYGPAELFPIVWAYLNVHPNQIFYEAIGDVVAWRLSRDWFTTFVKSKSEIGYAFSLQLAQQFRVYSDRIDNLEYKKAEEKIAYRILYLASRFGTQSGKSVTIEAPITHEIIANSINLARESVSRELEKLEHEGLVVHTGKLLTVLDINTLAAKLSRPVDLQTWFFG